jgi:hypothetical protein
MLALAPAADARITLRVSAPGLRAGRPARIAVLVHAMLGDRREPLAGALVTAGAQRARTGPDGRAELRIRPLRPTPVDVRAVSGDLTAAPVRLAVQPPIGPPLTRRPSVSVSAGAGARRVRAAALVDCSGPAGCDVARTGLKAAGCVPVRPGADLRIMLRRRPARVVDVQLRDERSGAATGGRAIAVGRGALGWRYPVRGDLPARATLTIVAIYPDRTGAVTVLRLRRAGC